MSLTRQRSHGEDEWSICLVRMVISKDPRLLDILQEYFGKIFSGRTVLEGMDCRL